MRFILFDRFDQFKRDLSPISVSRTRNIDGTDKLELTVTDEVQKGERILFWDSMNRWVEMEVASSDCIRSQTKPVSKVTATGSISELADVNIIEKRNRGASAAQCLAKALEGTRWTPGTVSDVAMQKADLGFYHTDVLQAIQSICDKFGLECETKIDVDADCTRIAGRSVNLLSRRGRESTSKRFEYGKDLKEIRRTIGAERVKTRLYGYGKGIEETDSKGDPTGGFTRKISFADINGGKPYVEDDNALQVWGLPGADGTLHHTEGVVEFPDCEDPAELLRLTKEKLKTSVNPTITYEATVIALGRGGMNAEGVDIGDSVQIVDTSFPKPLRLEGRVIQLEEDLIQGPSATTVTLGNIVEPITKRNARVDQAIQQLTGHASSWDEAATIGSDYLNGVIAGMNDVLNRIGGYVYDDVPGQGIMIYNKPRDQNPTQAIQLSGGFIRIADGKNSQGDWNFRTMANGHGIVADSLYTGIIRGGAIDWDLTNGLLTIKGPDGVRITFNAVDGFKIWQYGSYIGGLEIVDGLAYLRAARAGTSSDLYLTTGITKRNNIGASFMDSDGEYTAIEALTAVDGPQRQTNGVGMACFARPFLDASTYYRRLWLTPPEKYNTYMQHPDEQIYLDSLRHAARIQANDNCGLFINAGRNIILQLDQTHYITVGYDGIQCRCGSQGFGWYAGQFSSDLTWK
ncbi:MAG: phage tail protein [Bifidobacterium sp.]|nr:phage tail protein [Bifidobacterium sp.]